ncbi:MAG: GntP family permease, partial [Candidatus Parvarchaeota archaeon]
MSEGAVQVLLLAITIFLIVYFTARYKVNAFLVLILAALFYGVLSFVMTGTPPLLDVKEADKTTPGVITLITTGFGDTLRSIGIVIVLGVILGYFLEKSGAALVMAKTMLQLVGKKNAPLAMALTGYVVSIPVFCDSGFVILQALNRSLAQGAGISLAVMATALSMGLYSTHTLVPPTPGPLAAAANLGADLGLVIILGLVAAIPAMLSGWLFATRFGSKIWIDPGTTESFDEVLKSFDKLPSPLAAFSPVVIPLILIAMNSIASFPSNPFGTGTLKTLCVFLGNPNIALLIGVFLVISLTKWKQEMFDGWISKAIDSAGLILVITAAGGSLGAVIRGSGVGDYLGKTLASLHMGILLPFIIAAALKIAQGSSTVALITTSAILFPMLPALGWTTPVQKALITLAIGAGSMVVSHANDSYFWVVSRFSNMS